MSLVVLLIVALTVWVVVRRIRSITDIQPEISVANEQRFIASCTTVECPDNNAPGLQIPTDSVQQKYVQKMGYVLISECQAFCGHFVNQS